MKVKVNIIKTRCITVSEAVTMPSFRLMTATVSEESLARGTQTDRHTHTNTHTHTHTHMHTQAHRHTDTYLGLVCLKLFQSPKCLKTKSEID